MNAVIENIQEFIEEEDAVGVVEIILILVVLISLVIIFKKQLTDLVNSILSKITKQSNSICQEESCVYGKKRQYYGFSGTDFKSFAFFGGDEYSVGAGCSSQDADPQQSGYWSVFPVWTV